MRPLAACIALPLLITATAAQADLKQLMDIYPGNGGSWPAAFTPYGDRVYFVADDPTHGLGVWSTDGATAERMDLGVDNPYSNPYGLTVFGDKLYFAMADDTHGTELWVSDGTSAGTAMVADLNPSGSSEPRGMVVLGDRLYFVADDGVHGYELFATDGSVTQMVKEISVGRSPVVLLAVFDGRLYFSANDGTHGEELWLTDGVTTALVMDISADGGSSYPRFLAPFKGKLHFVAEDGAGAAFWTTNGTVTEKVLELPAGFFVEGIRVVGERMYYTGSVSGDSVLDSELWVTDGASAKRLLHAEFAPGSAHIHHAGVLNDEFYFSVTKEEGVDLGATIVENKLYATDGVHRWLVADNPASSAVNFDGKLYFSVFTGPGAATCYTDGTRAKKVADVLTYPSFAAGNALYLRGETMAAGVEPWVLTGAGEGGGTEVNCGPKADRGGASDNGGPMAWAPLAVLLGLNLLRRRRAPWK